MPFVELQSLSALTDTLPLWSAHRWAPARFLRADFLGPVEVPLVEAVRIRIAEETGMKQTGPIYLLANWRYFGYQNNPISVYYCYDEGCKKLTHVVAEVTNTPWGESHSYVLEAPTDNADICTTFKKVLHVSPFNPMEMIYQWRSSTPGDQLRINIALFQNGNRIFDAFLTLNAEPLDGKSARRALINYPLMTLKVLFGIYWQAVRLFFKGTRLYAHPKRFH